MNEQMSPLAMLLPRAQQEAAPPMLPAAQALNLQDAWQHYIKPKSFAPGELLIGHSTLGTFTFKPVILFVRYLDAAHAQDGALIADQLTRNHLNKLDCVVAIVAPNGSVVMLPTD